MKRVRYGVPILGIIALLALFFKLPELSPLVGCKTCASDHPYFALLGSGYFAALIAAFLLFPAFPGKRVARGGLTWAVLLALALTYINYPNWCAACLIAHACNISIWLISVLVHSSASSAPTSFLRERWCLIVFAPISVIALFSSLNLTFMAYGFKVHRNTLSPALRSGDTLPIFHAQTTKGLLFDNAQVAQTTATLINFISPSCPHCEEQVPIVQAVATQLASDSYRFINISPALPSELIESTPALDWIKDKDGSLHELFQVSGYPTLFIVGNNGKITKVISGVPDQLQTFLLNHLPTMKNH
jgi:thiol-disulfide isomerase/thioredoxin